MLLKVKSFPFKVAKVAKLRSDVPSLLALAALVLGWIGAFSFLAYIFLPCDTALRIAYYGSILILASLAFLAASIDTIVLL